MEQVVDSRMYAALQKLKGFVKLCHDSEGKLKFVKKQASAMAEAQKKLRESIPNGAKVSAPTQPKLRHLTLVK